MSLNSNIHHPPDLTENRPLDNWFVELAQALRKSRQRVLVVFQGSRQSCLQVQDAIVAFRQIQSLSNQADMPKSLPFSRAESLLGNEFDCVVLDLYSGIHSDVLCLAAGLIRAGGVLILLLPRENNEIDDPYGSWQNQSCDESYFRRYLRRHFDHSEAVISLSEDRSLPQIPGFIESTQTTFRAGRTGEQAMMLNELKQWLVNDAKPWFLLTADRGRGKSTLLGLFIKELDAGAAVLVTAASTAQVRNLLGQLDVKLAKQCFIAPDELIRTQQDSDLLVIDEAAMLPVSVLLQCMARAKKILMATTTGGYEGTGQGFLLKLKAGLDDSQSIHRQLFSPVRWGREDLLEQWLDAVLLMKADPQPQVDPGQALLIRSVSQHQLSEDESMLRSVYGLLVDAHYRTRPSDLRQLMEDPNLVIVTAQYGDVVVAVCLLNREGGLDSELCEQIYLGKRRPSGHLFAQMMTAQAGIRQFAKYRGLRVQRIAVDMHCRRQGIGRRLIDAAQDIVTAEGLDYLATTFALDAAVAPFWGHLDFKLVHIGSGRGKSSGRQTIALITSNHPEIQEKIARLSDKIREYLPLWMLAYCQNMYWRDVRALLKLAPICYELTDLDIDEIHAFTSAHRGFDLSLGALQKLVIMQLPRQRNLSEQQQQCLIEYVLMNKSWRNWKGDSGEFGKKALESLIRPAMQLLFRGYQGGTAE